MKRILLIVLYIMPLWGFSQQGNYQMYFLDYSESRGNSENVVSAELPYTETVTMFNPLNSSSGLGATLNFHGNVVVVDQMNVLPDGTVQIVIRREDGKNFFGRLPTLKAILKPITVD